MIVRSNGPTTEAVGALATNKTPAQAELERGTLGG